MSEPSPDGGASSMGPGGACVPDKYATKGIACGFGNESEYKVYVVRVGADSAGKAVVRADCVPASGLLGDR